MIETLAEFQDAMQRAIRDQKNPTQRIDRVRILSREDTEESGGIVDFDIKAINFDENSGTLFIEY